ncbi:MAG: hypothetical protein OXM02_03785 [Bacteroidota bacterium]|nr:hypothetical protein [Bacteroidota bacterium]MDE2957765.1 hypothetical protein [Bacteroidota bacterium]
MPQRCYILQTPATVKPLPGGIDGFRVDSPRVGVPYEISGSAAASMYNLNDLQKKWLTSIAQDHYRTIGEPLMLYSTHFEQAPSEPMPESLTRNRIKAPKMTGRAGLTVAENEIREAQLDILRKPAPDITGALQHARAALECTCSEVAGGKKGKFSHIVAELELPIKLRTATDALWAFASDRAVHPREDKAKINFHEAELVVALVTALCSFIAQGKAGEQGLR